MSAKEQRLQYAREMFNRVSPRGWAEVPTSTTAQGGNSGVCVVKHEDGREGVFRCLLADATDAMKKRFYRELEILPQMNHKNIMRLLDRTTDRATQWYISELGLPLDTYWSEQRRHFASDPVGLLMKAVKVCEGIAAGLAAVHHLGVVHRDIKPGNIIVMSNAQASWPVLIDFGIAYVEDEERITQTGEAVGNARYSASPMAYRTDDVPAWYDIFELAQVLMWMLERDRAAKHYWQRPRDWRFVTYDPVLPLALRRALQSVTAVCSQQETSPEHGGAFLQLLKNRFQIPAGSADPEALNERRINAIRAEANVRDDLLRVKDIAVIAASAPMALEAIGQVQAGFISMCRSAAGTLPIKIELDQSHDHLLKSLTDVTSTSIVVSRCRFGDKKKTFSVEIEAIIYRPSAVERDARFQGLPAGSNAIVFKLSRSGREHGVPHLSQRLVVSMTGELMPWVEAHFANGNRMVSPADVLLLLKKWSEDEDAWTTICS